MQRSIEKLGRKLISLFRKPNPNIATAKDLYYCYRLLLNREPDQKGFNDWLQAINQARMERQHLVYFFLQSEEFQQHTFQLENSRTQIDLPDFKIIVNPYDFSVGKGIQKNKSYEIHVSNAIKSQLKSGDTFVDIGANIGYFTLLAASIVGSSGHVYSFEPNPNNCKFIKQNITVNGYSNITLFPFAIAERKQTLNYHGGNVSSNGQVSDIIDGQASSFHVESVALDDILLEAEKITAIKMDIEGAEARALAGMHQIIDKFQPIIFTEFSPQLLSNVSHTAPENYLANLQKHYDIFILNSEYSAYKRMKPASIHEIMIKHAQSGDTHLDLVACPREVTN